MKTGFGISGASKGESWCEVLGSRACVRLYGAFPLHGTVRFGTARYGTVRLSSGRLHFHRSLVPL